MSETAPVLTPETASPPPSDVLGGMSSTERSHWRLTGEFPSAAPADGSDSGQGDTSDGSAASSPASLAEPTAETSATPSPASEPGTSKKAKNAETRKAELTAEIQSLVAERDRVRSETESLRRPPASDVPAASSPAQPVSVDQAIASPDLSRPMVEETVFFTAFPEATMGQYMRYVARYEAADVARTTGEAQSYQQRRQVIAGKLSTVLTDAPELSARLPPALMAATPVDLLGPSDPRGPWNYAAQELLDSPHATALFTHLADHPEDVQAIAASRTPMDTLRVVARLEARVSSPSSMTPPPTGKPVTSVPAPPQTLGTRSSAPANDVDAAVAAGDFAAYASAMNAKERTR